MAESATKSKRRPPVTGLRLDRELIRTAKYKALDDRTTLTKVVEEALKQYVRRK